MFEYLIAFLWGFAEATFFFFIPDIYLTKIALFNFKKSIKACFVAAFAACIGGGLMYLWASQGYQQAYRFLTFVPAIFPNLIAVVNHNAQLTPLYSLFIAPLKGIPYKIYAIELGAHHVNFMQFIVTSFFARLLRFILVSSFGAIVSNILKKYTSDRTIENVHIIVWLMVYSLYFCTEVYFYS